MTVFVVMGNDYPDSVFQTEEAAEAYCENKQKEPEARAYKERYGTHRIHWRVYGFQVR